MFRESINGEASKAPDFVMLLSSMMAVTYNFLRETFILGEIPELIAAFTSHRIERLDWTLRTTTARLNAEPSDGGMRALLHIAFVSTASLVLAAKPDACSFTSSAKF